ncbi:MAG TPA: hypothetical protein VMG31_08605 [Verrucomicrobiae bacterium]|nr:hypothetical protein [Verrucomicrobiae bacterium]
MSNWNVKTSTLAVLGCVVFVMLLIVVLPNADLPDTAFHRGTAPVVVHARATAARAIISIAPLFRLVTQHRGAPPSMGREALDRSPAPNFRPILFRSIRC